MAKEEVVKMAVDGSKLTIAQVRIPLELSGPELDTVYDAIRDKIKQLSSERNELPLIDRHWHDLEIQALESVIRQFKRQAKSYGWLLRP